MIIIIVMIIVLLYFYKNNKENNENNENFTTNIDSKKYNVNDVNDCRNLIIEKDSLNDHINEINNTKNNNNLLFPKHILPYNLNSTDQYNILNNYGIKNIKKRNNYFRKLNNNTTIPYNTTNLLNNYDNILNNTYFINTTISRKHPDIYLIKNCNKVQWSYETKYLDNTHFYLNFKTSNSSYSSLKLYDNLDHDYFKLSISNYKNRNIYKLEYTGTNTISIYVVLKENNNIKAKSNYIKLK